MRRLLTTAAAAALLLLGSVIPVAAQPDHTSCKTFGLTAASEAQALGAAFGALVSEAAQQGQVSTFVAALQAQLCEPR